MSTATRRQTQQLQADIEQQREELAETVDALTARLDVKARPGSAWPAATVRSRSGHRPPQRQAAPTRRCLAGTAGVTAVVVAGVVLRCGGAPMSRGHADTDPARDRQAGLARRPDQAVLDVRRPQDRAGVLQGPVHRPRRGADVLRRAGAVPRDDRGALAGRPGRAGTEDRHRPSLDVMRQAGLSSQDASDTITQLASTPGAGLALIIGLATALWSASGYVGRVRACDEPDVRGRRGPPDLEAAAGDAPGHADHRRAGGRGRSRPGRDRPGRRGGRQRDRSRVDRGAGLEHRQVAGDARSSWC